MKILTLTLIFTLTILLHFVHGGNKGSSDTTDGEDTRNDNNHAAISIPSSSHGSPNTIDPASSHEQQNQAQFWGMGHDVHTYIDDYQSQYPTPIHPSHRQPEYSHPVAYEPIPHSTHEQSPGTPGMEDLQRMLADTNLLAQNTNKSYRGVQLVEENSRRNRGTSQEPTREGDAANRASKSSRRTAYRGPIYMTDEQVAAGEELERKLATTNFFALNPNKSYRGIQLKEKVASKEKGKGSREEGASSSKGKGKSRQSASQSLANFQEPAKIPELKGAFDVPNHPLGQIVRRGKEKYIIYFDREKGKKAFKSLNNEEKVVLTRIQNRYPSSPADYKIEPVTYEIGDRVFRLVDGRDKWVAECLQEGKLMSMESENKGLEFRPRDGDILKRRRKNVPAGQKHYDEFAECYGTTWIVQNLRRRLNEM